MQGDNPQTNAGKLYLLGSDSKSTTDYVHAIDIEGNRSEFFPFNTVALILEELKIIHHEDMQQHHAYELVKVLINNKIYLCSRLDLHDFKSE